MRIAIGTSEHAWLATFLADVQPRRPIPPSLLLAASRGPNKESRIIGYRAAAWLFAFDGYPSLQPEFIVPHGMWRRGPFDHQRRRIDDIEVIEHDGVLVTSARQTLGDLCGLPGADLDIAERAVESAVRGGLDELVLRDFAWLFAFSRHGTPKLCEVLERRLVGERPTGSDLETLWLQLYRKHGLPRPIRQFPVHTADGVWVADADFGWWGVKFVVETDGVETHKTPEQVLHDTTRQNAIIDAGFGLRRFTWRHVTRTQRYVARETMIGLSRAGLDLSKIQKRGA